MIMEPKSIKERKNMKKIIALLLILVAVFAMATMTSCEKEDGKVENEKTEEKNVEEKADEPEASENVEAPAEPEASLYEIVDTAIKNTLAATSFEANVRIDKESDIMGNKESTWKDVVVKTSGSNVSVEGKKLEYGFESEHKYYYDGSWMYFDMYGDGYKRQVGLEEFGAEAGGVAGAIVPIPEAAFASATEKDGVVEVSLDEATAEALFGATIKGLVYDIVGEDLNQTTTKDTKVTLNVKDGYIENYSLSLVTEIVVGSDSAKYTFAQTINLSNVGGDVTVQFPQGYQSYNELDWG